ncbi:MAG TPA: TIGR03435 family protein [Acidobacteriaceae bacterium]|nr:TIGR03435 family protein [Acidobacteriaceae bacterium]
MRTTLRKRASWSLLRAAVLAGIASAAGAFGQAAVSTSQVSRSDEKPMAFEVVSIRREASATLGHDETRVTPDGWHMERGSLQQVLLTAYVPTTPDAMMYTVSTLAGIPDWVRTEIYDVDAKVPEADLAAWHDPVKQQAMLRGMLQSMLAERCKLVVHRSTKEVAVYSLVVGKGGSRLKAAVPGDPHPGATPIPGGGEFLPNDGTGTAAFYDAPVHALAVVLSNVAGRPVEDETGLTGRYDMAFRRPHIGAPSPEPDSAPSIFEVVEGLGLKLVPAKRTVETLVIDHVERPSEN